MEHGWPTLAWSDARPGSTPSSGTVSPDHLWKLIARDDTSAIIETSKGGGSPYSRLGSLRAATTLESPWNLKGTVPGPQPNTSGPPQVALGQEGPAGSRRL